MSTDTDAHEKRAREFFDELEARLIKVCQDPAIFQIRNDMLGELRELFAESARLGRKAARQDLLKEIAKLAPLY